MAWTQITQDDVKTRLSGPELVAMRSAALSQNQTDPLPEVIADVVNEVRGYIAGCPSNVLGPVNTIPERLVSATLNIIRYELATRLPVKGLVTEERKAAWEAAVSLLKRVADCKYAVEDPEKPAEADEQNTLPCPSISGRDPQFSKHSQDGI